MFTKANNVMGFYNRDLPNLRNRSFTLQHIVVHNSILLASNFIAHQDIFLSSTSNFQQTTMHLKPKFDQFKIIHKCFRRWCHWSFPQIDQKFSEFSEFRESDKSLKHELDSIQRSPSATCILLVLWQHLDLLHRRWQVQIIFFKI